MKKQSRGGHIQTLVYDERREESLARKTAVRDKMAKNNKLRKINPEKVAEEIMSMLERR